MQGKGSAAFVLVASAIAALVGLFMAARAEDTLFAVHGWMFVIFGVLMLFRTTGRLGDGS